MNAIDLFAGCGGLSKGFMGAGFQILLGVDNDQAALNTIDDLDPEAVAYARKLFSQRQKDRKAAQEILLELSDIEVLNKADKGGYVRNKGLDEVICKELILSALEQGPMNKAEIFDAVRYGIPGYTS